MSTEIETILKLTVPVIVQVAQRHMPLDNILALGPGAILELEKPADSELELLINNKPIGKGEAVKVGENFGIRILSIDSPQNVVRALGE